MKKDRKHHKWSKAQPHQVKTGKITKRTYAVNHPDKVEWVTNKKKRK